MTAPRDDCPPVPGPVDVPRSMRIEMEERGGGGGEECEEEEEEEVVPVSVAVRACPPPSPNLQCGVFVNHATAELRAGETCWKFSHVDQFLFIFHFWPKSEPTPAPPKAAPRPTGHDQGLLHLQASVSVNPTSGEVHIDHKEPDFGYVFGPSNSQEQVQCGGNKGLSKSYDTFWTFLAKIEIKLVVFIKK